MIYYHQFIHLFWVLCCCCRSKENGRRLGYMGHLIDMFDSLNLLVLVSHKFRALVESNLSDDELSYWKLVTEQTDGYLVTALKAQKSYLGGIDPNSSYSYETSISKEFQDDNYTGDYYNDIEANLQNTVDDLANEGLFEAQCSSRNLSAFDNDLTSDNIWSNNYNFDYKFDNNEGLQPNTDNNTDWADFETNFSEFTINDKNSFPSLKRNNDDNNQQNSVPNDETVNALRKKIMSRKTFAEVAANPWNHNEIENDNNANDIKRWASVVTDIGVVQTAEEIKKINENHTLLNNVDENSKHDDNNDDTNASNEHQQQS